MKYLDTFLLPLSGLKEGPHQFEFSIDGDFFNEFENSPILDGSLKVNVLLDKQPSLLTLDIEFKGKVEVICDRCADSFELSVEGSHQLIFKYGEEVPDEAEVVFIPEDIIRLQIAQYIFEAIVLQLPIQRIHPEDEEGHSDCNPETLKYLQPEDDDAANQEVNPIWEALNKLKN